MADLITFRAITPEAIADRSVAAVVDRPARVSDPGRPTGDRA